MFGKSRRISGELDPPPMATQEETSVEVLRLWVLPDGPQQVSLQTAWEDPGLWGLMLVDVARHVARAYERDGRDPNETLRAIKHFFDAEWSNPTDMPHDSD
jgi:hypothetical protein